MFELYLNELPRKTYKIASFLRLGLGSFERKNNGLASSFTKSNKRHVVVVFIVSSWAEPIVLTWMTIPSTSQETPTFPKRKNTKGRRLVNSRQGKKNAYKSYSVSQLWPFLVVCLKCIPHQRPALPRRSVPPCLPSPRIRIPHRKTASS